MMLEAGKDEGDAVEDDRVRESPRRDGSLDTQARGCVRAGRHPNRLRCWRDGVSVAGGKFVSVAACVSVGLRMSVGLGVFVDVGDSGWPVDVGASS